MKFCLVPNEPKNNIFGHIHRLTFFLSTFSFFTTSHTIPMCEWLSLSVAQFFSPILRWNTIWFKKSIRFFILIKLISLHGSWCVRDLSRYFISTTFNWMKNDQKIYTFAHQFAWNILTSFRNVLPNDWLSLLSFFFSFVPLKIRCLPFIRDQ